MESAPYKRTMMRRLLGFGVRVLVTAGLIGVAVYVFEWEPILRTLAMADPLAMAGALAAYLAALLPMTVRWRRMLTKHEAEPSLLWCYRVYLESHLVGLALPSYVGGDAYRVVRIRGHVSGLAGATVNVVAERTLGGVGLLTLGGIGLLAYPVLDLSFSSRLLIVGGVLGSVVLLFYASRVLPRIPGLSRLAPYVSQARAYMTPAREGAQLLGLSVLSNAFGAVSTYFCAVAVGVDASLAFFIVLAPALGILALVPALGGLGPAHGGLAIALIRMGATQDAAMAVAVLRVAVQLLTAGLGGVSLLFANGRQRPPPPQ